MTDDPILTCSLDESYYPPLRPDPTPQEIAERCARIQAEWSATERRKRTAIRLRPWEAPVVRTSADSAHRR